MAQTVTVELSDFDEDEIIEYLVDDILPYARASDKEKISEALKEYYPENIVEAKSIEEQDKLDILNRVFEKYSLVELEKLFPNI
jgi:hypothetical protein